MRTLIHTLSALCIVLSASNVLAQCPSGYNQSVVNWDYLDYFPSAGNGAYTGLSHSQTQYFAIGTQRITFTHNYTGSNAPGENPDHTADAGSYGSGEDLQYMGNGTVSFSFQSAVQNLKFSIYDIDYNQRITVTALNGASPVTVVMAKLSGTVLTVAGSGSTSASATASATAAVDNASSDGTVNIDITGPVTSVTISITQTDVKLTGPASGREDGSFWVSDVTACSAGNFAVGYYLAAKPYTNQPGYVLSVRNDSVYYVNPLDGKARFLFADYGHTNINSMAYDPVNHFVYYVYSLSGAGGSTNASNKTLRRYDYNQDTLGVVISDITALLPTFDVGVESGAAAFYDGALYLGIEASSSSSYESIVWKIDFNAAFAPVSCSQVYAVTAAGHDWADIGISNGVLYDFDGSSSAPNFYHINLLDRSRSSYTPSGGFVPRQTAIDWNGQVYNLGQPASGSTGTIAPYQYNGSINTGLQQTITFNGASVTGSWGDAAEAFKPKGDFGDAPSTYDPDTLSPAIHERDPNLRLGPSLDLEWSKTASASASADGGDEDGLPFVQILSNSGNYYTDVQVYNNTGVNATVCAWLDFNLNGQFETQEGTSLVVPSSPSMQTLQLYWPSVVTTLTDQSYTFLRIRVTSESNAMTTANPTGYFYNGEVEDFYVMVNEVVLDVTLAEFSVAKAGDHKASIVWRMTQEEEGTRYEIEKSQDAIHWTTIHTSTVDEPGQDARYSIIDAAPYRLNHYRLKYCGLNGKVKYSDIRQLRFESIEGMRLFPNPASSTVAVEITSSTEVDAQVQVTDEGGRTVFHQKVALKKGVTLYTLPVTEWSSGFYSVQLSVEGKNYYHKLVIKK